MEQKDFGRMTMNEIFGTGVMEAAKIASKKRFLQGVVYAPSTAVLQASAALDDDEGGVDVAGLIVGRSSGSGSEDMLYLGARLIRNKGKWGKDFPKHLKRLGISPTSAYLWMRCAKRFLDHDGTGDLVHDMYRDFPISLLYRIMRKGVPDEVIVKRLGLDIDPEEGEGK
nr:hypothetical protein [uncultured Sphaerochaeta sp.]